MNNTNEILERILLNMSYDPNKTLSENKNNVNSSDPYSKIKASCPSFNSMSKELEPILFDTYDGLFTCDNTYWCGGASCYFSYNLASSKSIVSNNPSKKYPANEWLDCTVYESNEDSYREKYCHPKEWWLKQKPTDEIPQELLNALKQSRYSNQKLDQEQIKNGALYGGLMPVRSWTESRSELNIAPVSENKNNIYCKIYKGINYKDGDNPLYEEYELTKKMWNLLGDPEKSTGFIQAQSGLDGESVIWSLKNMTNEEVAEVIYKLKFSKKSRFSSGSQGYGDDYVIEKPKSKEELETEVYNEYLKDLVEKDGYKLEDVKKEFFGTTKESNGKLSEEDLKKLSKAWVGGWRPGQEIPKEYRPKITNQNIILPGNKGGSNGVIIPLSGG